MFWLSDKCFYILWNTFFLLKSVICSQNSCEMSIYLDYSHHEMGWRIEEIHCCYPQYLKTTLHWHMQQDFEVYVDDSCYKYLGWPRKAAVCYCWQISQTLLNIKEICWHVFIRSFSGGCRHEWNIFKQLSDEHGYGYLPKIGLNLLENECITAKLLDREDILLMLTGLVGSTR